MVTSSNKKPRRQHILESFARMLEAGPGTRITTAALAKEVGVSEAALYRHFPSKTKMFEGLIEFIEDAVFTRINLIESEESVNALERCEKILQLLLGFAERNPGITRILTGDAIAGETSRLHSRVVQFFDRIETQMRQILREAELSEGLHFGLSINVTVKIWLAAAEGRIAQYVRSQFRDLPTAQWKEQWPYLINGFVVPAPNATPAATTA